MEANIKKRKVNRDKLNKLTTANAFFNEKYGEIGTETRAQFENETLLLSIGELLKESRSKLHLTQENLAKKTGLKRSYISKVEKGKTDIQITNLFKLLLGLDLPTLDINKLFGKTDENPRFA